MNVSYASAFLFCPVGSYMTFELYIAPVALVYVLVRLDSFSLVASMLGYTCQVVRGFSAFAPCLEHVCAGRGGGG